MRTSEHLLALAIQDTSTGLEFLGAQEVCEGNGHRVRRARCDGLSDAGLLLLLLLGRATRSWALLRLARSTLRLSSWLSLLLRLLLLCLGAGHHGSALLLHLLLDTLQNLLDGDALLLGLLLDLGLEVPLRLDLVLLDDLDLLGRGLLARRELHARRQLDRDGNALTGPGHRHAAGGRHRSRHGGRVERVCGVGGRIGAWVVKRRKVHNRQTMLWWLCWCCEPEGRRRRRRRRRRRSEGGG